ncbi:hypothetical protein [Candidatus Flexifilum breve]|uniref:hypothetical protein n=1 Tax=Candidatus Flexifilum breve TaxID=3140694 RepID=UPI003313041F
MDADAAGAGASAQLAALSGAVKSVQVPSGKDLNEFYQQTGETVVKAWLQTDCMSHPRSTPKRRYDIAARKIQSFNCEQSFNREHGRGTGWRARGTRPRSSVSACAKHTLTDAGAVGD